MPDTWKTIPINAGLLSALISGMAATVLGSYVLQLWIDDRVADALDRRLAPIEMRLARAERRVEEQRDVLERAQSREHAIINLLDNLIQRTEHQNAEH